jgi:adenylate cyclase
VARTRAACILRLEEPTSEGDQVFIVGDRTVILGRSADCDIVVPEESVSRRHARFSRAGEGWKITDLGSKNGVRVNTFKVEEQRLREGDRIDLGTVRIHVEIGEPPASRRADVVFSTSDEPRLHTEVLDISGLTSLLGSAGDASVAAPTSGAAEESDSRAQSAISGSLVGLVSNAAQALLACDSLEETLDRILALVFDHLPAERGVICLYDEENDVTTPAVMRTLDGVPDAPISISTNIAKDVVHNRQALLVRDTQHDDRFGQAESVIAMDIHSAMCAPLYTRGGDEGDEAVSGYIYIDRQSGSAPFDTPHLHALSTLALLSALAVEQARLRDAVRDEQELRARLARYSSPAVVDRIVNAPGGTERTMSAEECEVSVLFADLSGFTAMAERLRSAETIQILNRVFEELTRAIFEFEGTLDKYRGDGLMAFFGAPLPMADHAERACEAALRMQEALSRFDAGGGIELSMRIGVNSGSVVVGDIGSPQRKDYTVIGDVVNIASRLESEVARPGQVVIGAETWEQVAGRFTAEPLDEVQLKGRRRSVSPWLLTGRRDRPAQAPTACVAKEVD